MEVESKKINPLLFSPSPRDIPKVYDALKETGYDRLYSKYFTEEIAYNLGRDFFLKHEEYTHFVICPDDLVIEKKHIDALIKNLKKNDYQIHAGVCNVDNGKYKDSLCITENLPHPVRIMKASKDGTEPKRDLIGWRHYAWLSANHDFDEPIQSFYFSGFAAQFISRKVMETVKFEDDSTVNHIPNVTGGSLDVIFSNKMFQLNIPQMVDTRIRMNHLAGGGLIIPGLEESEKGLQKKDYGSSVEGQIGDGEVRFYDANEDTYDLIYAELKGIKRKWMMKNGKVIGQAKDTR